MFHEYRFLFYNFVNVMYERKFLLYKYGIVDLTTNHGVCLANQQDRTAGDRGPGGAHRIETVWCKFRTVR